MQIYILNRARETLATTASIYNDKHTLTLEAGSSSYEFTIDKSDEASHYLDSGNYIVLQDDKGKTWLFTILDYEETHSTKTVYAEDAGIELINKAVDIWKGDGPHPFSYYFDLVTKGTPWKLGVNQLAGLSRTLTYEGRDTGLGRLLSILKGFDNAECTFDVTVKMNAPAEFKINVYKQVGNDRSDVQIVYNNELNDITKKESRAEFVTALAGVGGQIQTEDGSEGGNVDFSELEYNKGGFVTKKGDKFLRAVDANRTFNPGQESYIESFYEYDTQSPSELLNRTLSKLKTYSEPQYTYTADVKVIDASLVLGDTVTILDHDYNPALYLSARVAKLVKSYTDPAQNEIEFTNYRLLNSALADKLARLQVIVNTLPSASRVSAIETNLTKLTKQQEEVIVKVESANGKNTNYYGGSQPESAKQGDSWFYTDEEGNQGIKQYQNGVWVDVISSKFGPKLEADIKQTQDDMQGLSDEVEEARSKAQEAFAKTVDNATNVQNVIRDVAQAHADLEKAKQSLQTTSQGLDQARQDLLSNSTRLDKLEVGVNGVSINVNNLNTKVDGIQIGGGKNIVRGTSADWQGVHTNEFNGNDNQTFLVGYAYLDQLSVGDSVTVSCHYQYSGVTASNAVAQIQGSGNVTGYDSGQLIRPELIALEQGTDLKFGTIKYTFKLNSQMVKNKYWEVRWRFNHVNQGAWFQWCYFKIEKGTTATPWSPAPEDEIERVSQLKVDLDGIQGTVANNQGDIAQIKLTENGMQQNIKDAQGNISSLQNDAKGFKQQFADTNGNIATIKRNATELSEQLASKVGNTEYQSFKTQTAKELSQKLVRTDLNGYATTAEVKLTADGLKEQYNSVNSKIDGLKIGGKNLLNGTSDFNSTYWYAANGSATLTDINGKKAVRSSANWEGRRNNQTIDLEPDTDYTISVYVRVNGKDGSGLHVGVYCNLDGTQQTLGNFNTGTLSTEWKRVSLKWHNDSYKKMTTFRIEWYGDFTTGGGSAFSAEPQLEKGNKPSDWGMSDNDINKKISDANASIAKTNETIKTVDGNVTTVKNNLDKTKSVVTQLANLFDVKVGDSSISVSNGGVLVKGKQIHIDGQTVIDNASIDGAKIKSLDAGKITTGTLNAAKLNVINLNASNITSGTLSGANLKLDLSTGYVTFQHGKLHNWDNTVDIDLDEKYLSTADYFGRIMFKGGSITITQPNIFDPDQETPYLKISNDSTAGTLAGGTIVGRDSVTIANSGNEKAVFTSGALSQNTFSGLFTGKDNIGNWQPTVIGGANRGVAIVGGAEIPSKSDFWDPSKPLISTPPYINVGCQANGTGFWGNRVCIEGDYVHIPSAQRKTTSAGPNVWVADDGALLRSTSAKKYKTSITDAVGFNYGDKLIEMVPKLWIDKAEKENYHKDPKHYARPNFYYGLIADDLDREGLTKLVRYDKNGEVEGIAYDRIAVALLPVIKGLKDKISKLEEKINER
ncbi:gp58-like family protein [Ligilactobacillus agilis]|nr:gp58-like family protein [Ligilactobacillus agilis]